MLHDLRIAFRSLSRSPLFTLAAAGSLAMGIAACTVIFSVVYTLLLRPLPYPQPEQLVHIGMGNPAFGSGAFGGLAPDVIRRLRQDSAIGFQALAGFGYDYQNLTGVPTPSQLTVGLISTGYFRVYGVAPALGRTFVEADGREASEPTVVLSDNLWRKQFSAAMEIVGQHITLGDKSRTVIGVMPPTYKDPNEGCELWLPLAEDSAEMASSADGRRYETFGRLSDASPAGRAKLRAVLATLSANLAQTDPAHYKDWVVEAHPLHAVLYSADTQRKLWLLFGAVGCVLLVTCANVANLQLVRAAARRREVGVRLALGASRGRIMRAAVTESLLLSIVGGGLGVLAASWGVDAVAVLLPPGYSPWQEEISLSWPVLGFAAATAVLAGVLTGLFPAWSAVRQDPAGALAAGGRGASEGPGGARVRNTLVVAEIALALVLLVGAGLMGRSLLAALQTDAGLRMERTLLINLSLSTTRYPDGPRRTEFYRRILEGTRAVPGVAGVALTTTSPFTWAMDFKFLLPGQDANSPEALKQSADYDSVNPACFQTLGIPVLEGRGFDDRDTAASPLVMVVNQTFARRFLPTGGVLGRKLNLIGSRVPTTMEIVGVVGNVRRDGLDQEPPPQAYVAYLQRPNYFGTLYVRAAGALAAESLTRPVESVIWGLDPDQPIGKVTTLEQAASGSTAFTRLYAALFAIFAALTLALAVLGIYGTVSYSVGQRTRELGIRLALGAQRQDVLRMVLGQGTRLIMAGLALGLAASLALSGLLKSLLYGVAANDPVTLIFVATVLGAVALLASYLPARRATKIDPLTALREE